MNAKQMLRLRKRINKILPGRIEAQNQIIDMIYQVEAGAEINILDQVMSDLKMKRDTLEEYLEEITEEEDKKRNPFECPNCQIAMKSVYDNVGFEEPQGQSKNEVIGLRCTQCGYQE